MIVLTNNWRIWMAGMAASLAIFLVVFFTTIQPSMNSANQAIKTGLAQSQQELNQAAQQVGSSGGTAGKQAQQQLSKASRLTACVAAAGFGAA